MYTRIFLIGLLCATSLATLHAQLEDERVDVLKTFDAQLDDARKVDIDPELPPPDTTGQAQRYSLNSTAYSVQYLPPRIRPIALRREKLPDAYNGYLRLGGGTPASIFGEGSYYYSDNDRFEFGLRALHHSANNTRKVENQRFSLNRFGAEATYRFDQGFAVSADLGYDLDLRHFYGYNELTDSLGDAPSFDKNAVRQRFSTFTAQAAFFNDARTVADFNYRVQADAYFMNDFYGTRENGFILDLQGTKWFNEKDPLTLRLVTDLTSYKDTATQNLSNFLLQPSYTFHGDIFKLKAGFALGVGDGQFAVFPDVEASVKIIGNILTAFVGADGNFQKNNFRNLTAYNPFIESRIQIRNSRYYHVFAGVQGEFIGVDYRVQGGWKRVQNLALFTYNGDSIPRFQVPYDTGSLVSIVAELSFPVVQDLVISGSITQNFFNLDNNERPWHLPSFLVNASVRYTLLDGKLSLLGQVFLENGVPFRDENGDPDNLNALFDVSLGGEYFVTKNFGLFVQFNNLANNRRQRWRFYPIYGFNVLGGLTVRL